jgi:hypothetical protein
MTACGKDGDQESAQTAATADEARSAPAVRSQSDSNASSAECGKGGTECPAGLECVTWRGDQQACGPASVESSVLITDGTLGGSCTFANPADTLPGASIATVHVVGNDGEVLGYGRMLWDEAGFEVAAERGTPPDGTPGSGDACANSYNIGCDGKAVFEIIDEGGAVQKLREGQMVIVHLRGQEACGEEVADEVEAAICNDPAAAASGDLSSCTFKVRMIEAPSDMYGLDRVGGTIQYIGQKK